VRLASTQRVLAAAICDATDADRAAGDALVAPSPLLTPRACVEIYADAYFFRLLEVLSLQYERTCTALGEPRFRDLVRDYLRAHPPRHFDVGEAGARLPDFLAGHVASAGHPEWSEIALCERETARIYQAVDAPALSLATLAAVPPVELDLLAVRLVPAHALLSLAYPVHRLWDDGVAAIRAPEETRVLAWRQDDRVRLREVHRTEWRLLHIAARAASLAELGERLAESHALDEAAGLLHRTLARWCDDELVARVA
jgi:hypothetical protein